MMREHCYFLLQRINAIPRINFTLRELAPASPAYEHFVECLGQQYRLDGGSSCCTVRFEARQLGIDFPQYFHYDRVEQMVSINVIIVIVILCLSA